MGTYRAQLAIVIGVITHFAYASSILLLIIGLGQGMSIGLLSFPSDISILWNFLLAALFPLSHSWLLTRRGRQALRTPFHEHGKTLETSLFVLASSVLLGGMLLLWSPSSSWRWAPHGLTAYVWCAFYGAALLFMLVAMYQAGPSVQFGYEGWRALKEDRSPRFSRFATHGLYRFMRHPIYLGFILAILTAPVWNLDHVLIAAVWIPYCVFAPIFKDRRYRQWYPSEYAAFEKKTPFFGIHFGRPKFL